MMDAGWSAVVDQMIKEQGATDEVRREDLGLYALNLPPLRKPAMDTGTAR
jgi:hypothetical protein